LPDAHSALGDARATAHLLAHYLDPQHGRPDPDHTAMPSQAAGVRWPNLPIAPVRPVARPTRTQAAPAPPGALWWLLDGLPLATVVDEGAPAACEPYLEVLFQALEDGGLTPEEAEGLTEVARVYAFGREQVQATHRAFLMALAHRIIEDGKVTQQERGELAYACDVLGFADDLPRQLLEEASAAREADLAARQGPLPDSWSHGEPLRIGDGIAFTGCDPLLRARLAGLAQAAGLRVTGAVSRKTVALVTDGANTGTSKAVAARTHGTRILSPDEFAILVEHVQPPAADAPPQARVPSQDPPSREDPATIRAWARDQGMDVGVRGRIPATVVAAYRAAEPQPAPH
jgi:DNA polymerase-3 subunit epsilon